MTQTYLIKTEFIEGDFTPVLARYGNDRLALVLSDVDDPYGDLRASVNLPDHEPTSPEHIFIKDYAENEGLLEALVASGIVSEPERFVTSGFVSIPECKVLIETPSTP